MKPDLFVKNLEPRHKAEISACLDAGMEKHLAPILKQRNVKSQTLHATVEPADGAGRKLDVRVSMRLPRRRLAFARAQAETAAAAVDQALAALARQIGKITERMRRQNERRYGSRRRVRHELKEQLAQVPAETRRTAETALAPLLRRLRQTARRELAFLRASGDLPADYPTLADAVDEALVRTKLAWRAAQKSDKVLSRLLASLFEVLDREVENSRQFGEMVSLEAPPPEDAEDQAEAMVGEEMFEFYQPDEALSLADVLADGADFTPDLATEDLSGEALYGLQVLGDMPIRWRRALMLDAVEDVPMAVIAELLGVTEDKARATINQARQFASERLDEAGALLDLDEALSDLGRDEAGDEERRADGG